MTPSLDQLAQAAPVQLHARLNALVDRDPLALHNKKWLVDAQVEPGQDVFELRPDEIQQDLLNSLLKLRERSLKRRSAEIRFLLEDADEFDARLYQRTTSEALGRLQRKLSSGSSSESSTTNGRASQG